MRRPHDSRRVGLTLIELVLSVALLAVVMGGTFLALSRGSRGLRALSSASHTATTAGAALAKIEDDLERARGLTPTATLAADLTAADAGAVILSDVSGFPDQGVLLLDRGGPSEERIRYAGKSGVGNSLLNLTRGSLCTTATSHLSGSSVLWAGQAEPIQNQVAPPPSQWDGMSLEAGSQVYFAGDGTGFCYQVPVDPAGGTNYLVNGQVTWGAVVGGTPTVDGAITLYFDPQGTVLESDSSTDLNRDGDTLDVFDLGTIRRRAFDSTGATAGLGSGLCPPIVIQEACNWGGDLDSDGFDDPMFLWDPGRYLLHVRLFVVAELVDGRPVVHRVETQVFLPNSVEN